MKYHNHNKIILVFLFIIITGSFVGVAGASVIGEQWSIVNGNASWSPRYFHTALAFNDSLWVLGGYGGNDIWSSRDGDSWDIVTDQALWLPRNDHSSVVFNNEMWVIGGASGSNLKNDVWHSNDGITWIMSTGNASWAPRFGQASIVFDNKLWILGGIATAPASVFKTRYNNDVWFSSDGATWHLVTENASWAPREGHSAFVYDNKMWVVGGQGVNDRGELKNYNDVWFSSDGEIWHPATENASWTSRYGHQSLVFGQRMWVLGGDIGISVPANDIWYSYDGKTWYPSSLDAEWSPRFGHQALVFKNRMWILGGKEPGNAKDNSWIDYGNGKIYTSPSPHEILFNDVWNSDSVINSSVTAGKIISKSNVTTIPTKTKSTPISFLTILLSLTLCIVNYRK